MKKIRITMPVLLCLCAFMSALWFNSCVHETKNNDTHTTAETQPLEWNREPIQYAPEYHDVLNYVFDLDNEPAEIFLSVSLEEWNTFLRYYDQNPQHEESVFADFVFKKGTDEVHMTDVKLRMRGNTSRRRPEAPEIGETGYSATHQLLNPQYQHFHIKIDFDKMPHKGRTFLNTFTTLNFKWFKGDPTHVREVYAYDLFYRAGIWTAPRSAYVRMTVQIADEEPVYFGLYEILEQPNAEYLAARTAPGMFSSAQGDLWKMSHINGISASLTPESIHNSATMGVEEINLNPSLSRVFPYDLKTNKKAQGFADAQHRLRDFITQLNTQKADAFMAWIEKTFALDMFLKTYAIHIMLGSWDDYWVNGNNYYMYFDTDGKVHFIPWDYDNILGTSIPVFAGFTDSGRQHIYSWGNTSDKPLIKNILAVDSYKNAYTSAFRFILDPANTLCDSTTSIARAKTLRDSILSYIPNDIPTATTHGAGSESYTAYFDEPAFWGTAGYYRLFSGTPDTQFFKARERATLSQLP